MIGMGLLKGMRLTLKRFVGKKVTVQYPEERLTMPERFRGGHLVLDKDKCISCKLCAMACPNKALELTVSMDEAKKRHMDKYQHDSARCLYCDLCMEACPVKALRWDQEYDRAVYRREDLIYDCVAEPEREVDSHG